MEILHIGYFILLYAKELSMNGEIPKQSLYDSAVVDDVVPGRAGP